MVARDDQQALPTGTLKAAPTLLACFLEALAKHKCPDQHPQATISPSADPGPDSAEPFPAERAADLFSK